MLIIDFNKPYMYENAPTFYQGELSTNNSVRCKLKLSSDIELSQFTIVTTFKVQGKEITKAAEIVDAEGYLVDIVLPTDALVPGENELELLLTSPERDIQSPTLKYEIWKGLTTGEGVEGTNNYMILIDLINTTKELVKATDRVVKEGTEKIREMDATINRANTTITETNKAKDEALKAADSANKAIASGTQDLEVKQARVDMDGVEHANLKVRLESDLKKGASLAVAVSSNTKEIASLNKKVIDLEGLKESQEMAYETNKGYLVCKETKNGTVKDLKIKGKSLVNLTLGTGKVDIQGNPNGWASHNFKHEALEIGKEYVIKIFNVTNVKQNMYVGRIHYADGSVSTLLPDTELIKGVTEKVFTVKGEISYIQCATKSFTENFTCDAIIVNKDDYVGIDGYFEGIASAGTGADKIEVSSIKSDGNLFDGHSYINGGLTTRDNTNLMLINELFRSYIISNIEPNTKYTVRVKNCGNRFGIATGDNYSETAEFKVNTPKIYSSSDTTGQELELNIISEANDKYLFVYIANNGVFPSNIEIIVNKGDSAIFSEYIQDKKSLLFKDADGNWKPIKELRGLDTVCDTVELHSNGKYYYHVRTKELILQGTDNMFMVDDTQPSTTMFAISGLFKPLEVKQLVGISDKFNFANIYSTDEKGVYVIESNGNIVIRDSKMTLEGMKAKLQANPVKFIVGLAEEKVFEVNPLFLESFEDETMVSVNSGAINAPIEFKIASHISNLVLLNQERIRDLENEIYKSQEIQNIMILENDMRLMDLEFALMENSTFNIKLGGNEMVKGVTEFEFLKGRIESGSHSDEYLEKCINKYKKANRLTQEEYDILYDMIYPPVYEILPIQE